MHGICRFAIAPLICLGTSALFYDYFRLTRYIYKYEQSNFIVIAARHSLFSFRTYKKDILKKRFYRSEILVNGK